MQGLSDNSKKIFDLVSKLNCIKEYTLVGGTALSIQIKHRLSEDIDFVKWKTKDNERPEVSWPLIEKELKSIGDVKTNVLDFNQVDFLVNGVQVSFYANQMYRQPEKMKTTQLVNNIKVPDLKSIAVMKTELIGRRGKFRDYYDIYSLTLEGIKLSSMIQGAVNYSNHRFKAKIFEAFLINSKLFGADKNFELLKPKYRITGKEIELEFVRMLREGDQAVSISQNQK